MDLDLANHEALIADWDGTLVDSQPLNFRGLAAALAPRGLVLDQGWYRARLGTSVADLLVELGSTAPVGDVLEACGQYIISEVTSLRAYTNVVALVEAARAAGLRTAIASGGAGPVVRAGLVATGLAELFEVVVTREDAEWGKPAPDLFLEAARRLGVTPARCVVIEDAEEGIAAAVAAGMRVVDVRPFVSSCW
ncbi:HAD family hydrolase [Streptomyces sp. NBC_01803]|uniref:HAD family hydrolase n=1 Tax=Streptomyces sp. NBC_01803 TaxID=2975946 RepID=UPI002DDB8E9D|nr:HAD family phosphatase [Streptomyces sp. NBC_01803]WSA43710.1 HAD family phosphatase [Streptomyces sp. NBC_01803]